MSSISKTDAQNALMSTLAAVNNGLVTLESTVVAALTSTDPDTDGQRAALARKAEVALGQLNAAVEVLTEVKAGVDAIVEVHPGENTAS